MITGLTMVRTAAKADMLGTMIMVNIEALLRLYLGLRLRPDLWTVP